MTPQAPRFYGFSNRPYPIKSCTECGAAFSPIVPKQRACSDKCMQTRAIKMKKMRKQIREANK